MTDPHAGEVVDQAQALMNPHGMRIAHCECGALARPLFADGHPIGYFCSEHGGPLSHDELIWVIHDIKTQP